MSEKINGYHIHPMASTYPLLQGEELQALAEDIKQNGQLEPVIIDRKSGLVIDGRNRLAACGLISKIVETKVVAFDDDKAVFDDILSRNSHRRHMTKTARCVVVARLLEKTEDIEDVCERIGKGLFNNDIEKRAVKTLRKRRKAGGGASSFICYVATVVGCSASAAADAQRLRKDEEIASKVVSGEMTEARARKLQGNAPRNKNRKKEIGRLEALREELKEAKEAPPVDPVALQRAKEKNRQLTKHNKELIDRLDAAEARVLLHQEVSSVHVPRVPIADRPVGGRREATAVCVISDAHVEERVDLEETNGRNEYSPDICRARFEKLGQGLLWHLELFRSMYDIPSLVLPILGDMISGQIHDELIETNYLSQVPAIRLARDCVAQVIHRVLDETDISQITVPCIVGNHSRMTTKQNVKKAAENSFELVLYTELQDAFQNEPRITFIVAPGKMLYLEVYDYVLRFLHGDQVSYNGGIGGVTVPLHKKIGGWDTERKADVTVMGHHHSWLALPHAVINGSIVGYNEYAKHIGARYEPPQQAFFLMDSERGYRHATRIFVDSVEKER